MKSEIFIINQDIQLGHRFDHNTKTVTLTGFERLRADSTLYLKMDKPVEALVPLTDDLSFTVQQYMTLYSGQIRCQILESLLKTGSKKEYEIINNSHIFYATVKDSIKASFLPEVTDPSLDLIYTQMHEMYLTVKNAYESGEFKGEKGEKGDKGDTGDKGTDGHTPIKGTDYWTDADKQEIIDNAAKSIQLKNTVW